MRQTLGAMLDAEERAKADGDSGPISAEEMAAADTEGLIDEAHLGIFLTWWTFGGMEHPPTITEIANMPAAMQRDLTYLLREFGKMRRQRRRRKDKTDKRSKTE